MSPFKNIVCFLVFLLFVSLYLILTHTNPCTDLFTSCDPLLDLEYHKLPVSEPNQSTLVNLLLNLSFAPNVEHEAAPGCRSTRVRETPFHLKDYHYFSTIMSLVKPSSYHEAYTNPLWQQAMNE